MPTFDVDKSESLVNVIKTGKYDRLDNPDTIVEFVDITFLFQSSGNEMDDVESVKPMVSEIKTAFPVVVETLSDRDRVSAGSMT